MGNKKRYYLSQVTADNTLLLKTSDESETFKSLFSDVEYEVYEVKLHEATAKLFALANPIYVPEHGNIRYALDVS